MLPWLRCLLLGFLFLGLAGVGWLAADETTQPKEKPATKAGDLDLSEFKTVETAQTTTIRKSEEKVAGQPGYLGAQVTSKAGQLVVAHVEKESPASAVLKPGDIVEKCNDRQPAHVEELRDFLQAQVPGSLVKLMIRRGQEQLTVEVKLGAVSRPLSPTGGGGFGGRRALLGVQVESSTEPAGLKIVQISPDSAAANARLKAGDILRKIDGQELKDVPDLTAILSKHQPGDQVNVAVVRDGKEMQIRVTLGGEPGMGFDTRRTSIWKKDTYRLAVVCIEYPDVKHNPQIKISDWEEALFSKGTYVNKKNPTGSPVYGSLYDYYLEQSYGKFKLEGKVFDYVQVSKKREEYTKGTGFAATIPLFSEALDKLLAREGKNALDHFDGLFFLHAGGRVKTNRGGLYWPHKSSMRYQGKLWHYFICAEGGKSMDSISVIAHEFGHMLGLPDLYARPENPGSEGVGAWCAMSNQAPGGKPQHFGAWTKEQLGWLKPAIIDPTVPQKLVLSPVTKSPRECFKVLVRRDGSEYFLLENRAPTGFDASLPAHGLLIWRVVGNRPILEESHGITGPTGPRVYLKEVPYPSRANNAFTPFTTPSSRSQLGGGLPVHITNIQRLPDGRITFFIGYEYL